MKCKLLKKLRQDFRVMKHITPEGSSKYILQVTKDGTWVDQVESTEFHLLIPECHKLIRQTYIFKKEFNIQIYP